MLDNEIRNLIDVALDEVPSPKQLARLEELLATDEDARKYYIEEIILIGDIERSAFSVAYSKPMIAVPSVNAWTIGIMAILSMIVLFITVVRLLPIKESDNVTKVVFQDAIAKIVGGSSAGIVGMQSDGVLNEGHYELEGSICLLFRNGASVEITGPAKFEIQNALLMVLHLGSARVHAPESAKGFLVAIPGMEVRDIGTEFGVSVAPDRSAEVHVFLGAVELLCSGAEPRLLEEGNAISWEGKGIHSMSHVDDSKFPTRSSIGYEIWQASFQRWQTDPSAIVLFDFKIDSVNPNRVINLGKAGDQCNGVIEGPVQVSGRWPEKPALLLDKGDDRIQLNVPNEYQSFTLSTWVCATRRTELSQAVFMTLGDESGEHHLQIGRDGSVRGGVQKVYSAASHGNSAKVGVWQHIAVVVDTGTGSAKYFVNGEVVAHRGFDSSSSLVFGPCSIGAWKSTDGDSWSRRFRGRIDEFALFDRALTATELMSIFQDGSGFATGE